MNRLLAVLALLLLAGSSYAQLNHCVSCEFFVGSLISSLPANPTVDSISTQVDKLCDRLPSSFSRQCHAFVKSNRDAVVQFLSNGRSAEYVCKAIHMCSDQTQATHTVQQNSVVMSAEFKAQDTNCDFCTFVMWQVQSSLRDNYTISNIANTLNAVCQHLPVGNQDCLHFVNSYFPLLIKYLAARDTAIQVCKLLGQCTNDTSLIEDKQIYARAVVRHYVATHPFAVELRAQSSSGCQLCQWIVSAGEAWLSDGHNEAEISNFLQQVCNFFNQYAAQCQQLVAVYTPKVIEMLVENYTPPYICGQIGGCSP